MADLESMSQEERDRLARFANSLLSNTETSKEARRLAKKLDPNFQTPDLDLDDRINSVREEEAKKRKELEDKLLADQLDRRRSAEHEKIRAAGEDPEYIEKLMTEKRIGSYDTALWIAQKERESSAATPPSMSGRLELEGDTAKDFWKDPSKTAAKIAHQVIDDFKKQGFRAR